MAMPLVIALAALLTVSSALLAMLTLEDSPYGWTVLVMGLLSVVPAALLVARSRYAEGFLRATALVAIPLGPAVLLAIVLRGERPVPTGAVGTVVLGTIAGVAYVIAIVAGTRFLRAAGVRPAGVRVAGAPAAPTKPDSAPAAGPTSPLRVRHVLSAYAAGAGAGFYANGVTVLGMLAILAVGGSPMPPEGLDSLELAVASALGAVLIGLFHTSALAWLPRPLPWRSAAYAAVGAPILAGVHATAAAASSAASGAALPWIVASAIGTAAMTPIMLRATLWVFVRSIASVAALSPGQSALLLGLSLLVVLYEPPISAEVVAASPLGFGAVVAIGALLGILAWTTGLRPADRWPGWFQPLGLAGLVSAALAGAAMLVGAVAG